MIRENVKKILSELPVDAEIVAAAKSRNISEVKQAVEAGIKIVGENYIQEADEKIKAIGKKVKWHFIGHLQRNKVKEAIEIFDMIETLDSLRLAQEINKACQIKGKVMPVLIELNSAEEKTKFGLLPNEVDSFISEVSQLRHIKILGLMTMGPILGDAQDLRPLFQQTDQLFKRIKSSNLPNVKMRYLSMGMSDSYKIAIEEGANLVRIGTAIFGQRKA